MDPFLFITAGKFIYDMNKADKNNEAAERISVRAANTMGAAETKERENNSKFRDSKNKVLNRKSAVINSSFPKFMAVYEKITKIEFNYRTKGIDEIFQHSKLDEFENYMGPALSFNPPSLTDQQLLAGFMIDGIKGSVFGADPLISGITSSIVKDSELQMTAASAQRKQANLYEKAVESKSTALESICFYMDKVSDIISRFNGLFLKSMRITEEIIDKNGYAGSNYSDGEVEKIGICMDLAKALKKIVDTPIIDENNQIANQAKELVEISEQYFESFSNLI